MIPSQIHNGLWSNTGLTPLAPANDNTLSRNRVERLFTTRGVHRKGPLFYLYSFLSIPAGGVLTEVKGFAVFRHLDGADRVVLYTAQLGVSGEIVHNVFR